MTVLRYVDLGTKVAGALDCVRKRATQHGLPKAHPRQCLGIDRLPKYENRVRRKGYQFELVDLNKPADWSWPQADCYLAWNFLEHLNSIEIAQQVLRRMLTHSRQCVWLLLPSYEDSAREILNARGYEFAWHYQKGHRAHVQKRHVAEVTDKMSRVKRQVWRGQWPVTRLKTSEMHSIAGKTQKPGPVRKLSGAWEGFLWLK
jgi:hypothetical protein